MSNTELLEEIQKKFNTLSQRNKSKFIQDILGLISLEIRDNDHIYKASEKKEKD